MTKMIDLIDITIPCIIFTIGFLFGMALSDSRNQLETTKNWYKFVIRPRYKIEIEAVCPSCEIVHNFSLLENPDSSEKEYICDCGKVIVKEEDYDSLYRMFKEI